MVNDQPNAASSQANPPGLQSLELKLTQLTDLVSQLTNMQLQSQVQNPTNNSSIFRFESYSADSPETVEEYLSRFKLQLKLRNIPEADWSSHLRVHMGPELNSVLSNLTYPTAIETLDHKAITEKLTSYYDKSHNKFSKAINFRKILQKPGEKIVEFVARLKFGAKYCKFEEFLDYSLTVQLIHGICRDDIRDEIILSEPKTFQEAVTMAMNMEASKAATKMLKPSNSSDHTVNILHDKRPRLKHGANSRYRSPSPRHGHSSSNSPRRYNSVSPPNSRYDYSNSPRRSNPSSPVRSHNSTHRSRKPCYPCKSCGGQHWRSECKYRKYKRSICNTIGHLAADCRKSNRKNSVHEITEQNHFVEETEYLQDDNIYRIQCHESRNSAPGNVYRTQCDANAPPPPMRLNVLINGQPLSMELDTASSIAVISAKTKDRLLPHAKLLPSSQNFSSFTRTKFNTLGYVPVNVTFKGRTRALDLYVVAFGADSLFGREWIKYFSDLISFQDFTSINQIKSSSYITPDLQTRLNKLCDKFPSLFKDQIGEMTGPKVEWHLKQNVKPKFTYPRHIPYSLKERYKKTIDKKIESGLYEKVTHSEWASPTHVVVKGDKIRTTGDYKTTLNPQLIVDEHPIPHVDELFNKIGKAKVFCRLDILDAFMHLPCTKKSCELMTLNTPTHGLIRPLRAQPGISSVPAVWQRRLEEILLNTKGAAIFFDDILLFADTIEEMFRILEEVFRKLSEAGLVLNLSKCKFFLKCIEFLGHLIDGEGLHKLNKHIEAVLQAQLPTSSDELKSFIGEVTYYHAFIPHLSSLTHPLREMLKIARSGELTWTEEGLESFRKLKTELVSERVLVPYDPNMPLILAVDASPTGLGAVLSHQLPGNVEKPIAYASRALSPTESAYPQNDREALAIVWGVKKFFQYVYGRHFTLYCDNKAVSHIFAPDALLPKFSLSRLNNYASYLSNFS
ncbi:uncharacterized protein [Bemisia tabaci]|uniref:uncharacterized protein n=1 Tax=Bemisia tabaci TaxID=7038 RepID=UPI003B286CFB